MLMCIVQYCIRDNKFEKIVSELNFLYLSLTFLVSYHVLLKWVFSKYMASVVNLWDKTNVLNFSFSFWHVCEKPLVRFMVFNATFNNISVISWQSVLLVEETREPGENHRPAASHWQTLSDNVVSSTSQL